MTATALFHPIIRLKHVTSEPDRRYHVHQYEHAAPGVQYERAVLNVRYERAVPSVQCEHVAPTLGGHAELVNEHPNDQSDGGPMREHDDVPNGPSDDHNDDDVDNGQPRS